jgi:hypothetical protein
MDYTPLVPVWAGADLFLNVQCTHNTVMSYISQLIKESMAWYSSSSMPSFWLARQCVFAKMYMKNCTMYTLYPMDPRPMLTFIQVETRLHSAYCISRDSLLRPWFNPMISKCKKCNYPRTEHSMLKQRMTAKTVSCKKS